jgi:hypothetical protein
MSARFLAGRRRLGAVLFGENHSESHFPKIHAIEQRQIFARHNGAWRQIVSIAKCGSRRSFSIYRTD